jgi:hypothetical protein
MQTARDRFFDRTAALMFATTVAQHGDPTPPCERAANDGTDRDPPRPAAAAGRPARWTTVRLAA